MKKKKQQKIRVLYIHGGMTFKTEKDYLKYLRTKEIKLNRASRWSAKYLGESLGARFEIITPRMPLSDNAKYRDWKILFERYLPLMGTKYILIGESLGGIFLAKYLSENKLKRKALAAYMVCAPFDNSLTGEDLVGGFMLGSRLSRIEQNAKKVRLLFSADDDVVPVSHAGKYRKKLPTADITVFNSKNGHFNIAEFPEIVRMIKADIK